MTEKTEEQLQAEAAERMKARIEEAGQRPEVVPADEKEPEAVEAAKADKAAKAKAAKEARAAKAKANREAKAKKAAEVKAAKEAKEADAAKAKQPRATRGPSLKLLEYESGNEYDPPREGTKAHAIVKALLDRKGATLQDIQGILIGFDENCPHGLPYCRSWLAKSYLNTLFGLGLRTKVVKLEDGTETLKAYAVRPKVKPPVTPTDKATPKDQSGEKGPSADAQAVTA